MCFLWSVCCVCVGCTFRGCKTVSKLLHTHTFWAVLSSAGLRFFWFCWASGALWAVWPHYWALRGHWTPMEKLKLFFHGDSSRNISVNPVLLNVVLRVLQLAWTTRTLKFDVSDSSLNASSSVCILFSSFFPVIDISEQSSLVNKPHSSTHAISFC